MLRWFWWRINAFSELSAMIISFVVAMTFVLLKKDNPDWTLAWWLELVLSVGITTVGWLVVTFLTPTSDMEVLKKFYNKVQPGGKGWNPVRAQMGDQLPPAESLAPQIGLTLMGIAAVYGFLFGIGQLIYSNTITGLALLLIAAALGFRIIKTQMPES